jgi:hypothetical protein
MITSALANIYNVWIREKVTNMNVNIIIYNGYSQKQSQLNVLYVNLCSTIHCHRQARKRNSCFVETFYNMWYPSSSTRIAAGNPSKSEVKVCQSHSCTFHDIYSNAKCEDVMVNKLQWQLSCDVTVKTIAWLFFFISVASITINIWKFWIKQTSYNWARIYVTSANYIRISSFVI